MAEQCSGDQRLQNDVQIGVKVFATIGRPRVLRSTKNRLLVPGSGRSPVRLALKCYALARVVSSRSVTKGTETIAMCMRCPFPYPNFKYAFQGPSVSVQKKLRSVKNYAMRCETARDRKPRRAKREREG